tara:strand:+ start:535 stop:1752 length:1218 start_codon:yes stop_codon:yes gene_type:complete
MNNKPLKKNEVIKIFKSIKKLKTKIVNVNIENSNKCILAEDIISSINVPPFKNSAVDGYAIRNKDINYNGKFKIIEKILAGENKDVELKLGETIRVFTGARLPKNAQTVIMQENAIEENNYVTFLQNPKKNQNRRLAGEDIKKNKLVFKKGTIIELSNQSILASIGLNKIKIYKKLSIGIFTSGNELKNPTKKLIGSQINNSNRYALFSLISQAGFKTTYIGTLKDNLKNIESSIGKAVKKFDIIITTGGASVGDEDHLVKIINRMGKLIFWKIAIKPGRPVSFGFIKKKPIICLPGNPVSVFLLFSMLIKPFFYHLSGSEWIEPKSVPAKINFDMKKKTERMEWLRVIVDNKMINELTVSKYNKQGSGIISSIAFSDGIIEIPEDYSELKSGDVFRFYSKDALF